MIEILTLGSSSKGNCYRITDGTTSLLLEAGLPYKEIQKGLGFKISDIQGCLVSHEHMDHAKSVKDLVKSGITCYMGLGTIGASNISSPYLKQVKAKEQFSIDSWTILPFDVEHDAAEPLGYLLQNKVGEKLLFATDTYYIKYKFEGLTHIMVECNYSLDILKANVESGHLPSSLKNRLLQSHFSLDNVKKFLMANDLSKVREIYLLHLSDGNSDADRFKKEIQELTGKVVYIC